MNKLLSFLVKYKIFVIIAIIIIIGVILLFLFYPPVKYFGSSKFNSDQYGISFYLPKNWKEIDDKTLVDRYNQAAKLGFAKTNSANASFIIKIDDQKGKKDINIQGSMEELKKIFSEKLKDFELIYMKESVFQDIPCIEAEYVYGILVDASGNQQKTQQKQIIFLKNEKLYWLIFASYPQDFQRDNKDFDEILQTFKFK